MLILVENHSFPRTAAFFDLDKTVIAKSSTLAFSKSFYQGGLINRRAVLRTAYAQFVYMLGGADHDQMERMREYLSALCRGWNAQQVREIVAETLLTRGLTIATAESCTAGLLAGRLADRPGSSAYLLGGLVTYANEAKSQLAERKVIDRAKAILMKAKSIGEDEAYGLLRKAAMNEKKKLSEIAQAVVTAAELLR